IEVSTPLVHRTIERTSSITPYKNEVIQLLNKRVSKNVWCIIEFQEVAA
ncbi:hypothetical protein H6A04_12590, partial [Fusobacterium mortiferum]|nr:hypothetical protein [Fusobacterium mortiferum]